MNAYRMRSYFQRRAEQKKVEALMHLLAIYDAVNLNAITIKIQTTLNDEDCRVACQEFEKKYGSCMCIAKKQINMGGYIFPKGRYLRNLSDGMKRILTSEFAELYERAQKNPEELLVALYFLKVGDSEIFEECADFHKALRAKGYNKAAEYLRSAYLQDLSFEELRNLL